MHPPKPSLGRVVGSRSPLPAPWGRECPRSAGSARPVCQPAAHPQARADPAAARARAPRHLESKFGPADGAWRTRVAGGGRSLRGDAAALAADPGSLECAFVQWSRQCQRRRVTSALSVRTRRRRRRTRPAAPRPRHAAAARTCARRPGPSRGSAGRVGGRAGSIALCCRSLPEGLREAAGGLDPRPASTPSFSKTSGDWRRLCPPQDTCECKSTCRRVQIKLLKRCLKMDRTKLQSALAFQNTSFTRFALNGPGEEGTRPEWSR